MTLRPIAAHWFDLVTVHQELARLAFDHSVLLGIGITVVTQ